MDVQKVWLTNEAVWIETVDGSQYKELFNDYPRLKFATAKQRKHYEIWGGGIHWPELDEDLSFEGFTKPKNNNRLYRIFTDHPELNASAVARRLGISQSLFAQYISGTKKPSPQREELILGTIRQIGQELREV